MIDGFAIRPAVEADVPLILAFIRKLAGYERLTDEVEATEERLRQSLFREPRGAEVIIGEYHRTPVAFALYFHNYSTFLGKPGIYIEDLYVDEPYRRNGFGFAMLQYIARLAKERDCGRVEWAVLDWNEPAIRFYESLGAQAMSQWTIYRLSAASFHRLAEANCAEGRNHGGRGKG